MKNILYVEDDAINALVMTKLLKSVFNVAHVFDGETCMHHVEEKPFDAILMDINLGKGKMDGVQTLHKLRAIPRLNAMPVIAVTSYALPEDRERFLQEGFDAYMSKPVDRAELIALLARVLSL
ncbi:response regulator [Chryseolinea sp. T2]|uniref:response regulator n=1 Tax=Chryseolinea sp. T2 TaxID=3129255 RepID=UPI003077B125